MRISTFFYCFRQGIKNLFKNKLFTLASISTMTACIFLFGMFAVVSVVLAIVEGMKKDKRALLKKFLSNVTWISIAYIVPCILDYFYETEFSVKFEFGKIALQVLITALAIMGGEYMLTDHGKENQDEFYF